jgi:PAS domain S-box-containing protein
MEVRATRRGRGSLGLEHPDRRGHVLAPLEGNVGYAEHEIGNFSEEWARRVHPEDMPRVMAELQTHLDGQKVSAAVEFRMLCKDGSWRWTLGRGMVVRRDAAGQPLRLVGTNSDISERKARDEALKRSNAELEQFNYAIAHDMRQPLRMISSYLQLLEMSLAESLDTEQSECLNFAIDGAKRLDQMLVGLLAFARVGRNGEVAPSSSRAALEEALHFVQSAVAEAHAASASKVTGPGSPSSTTKRCVCCRI